MIRLRPYFRRISPAVLSGLLLGLPLLMVLGAGIAALIAHREVGAVLATLTHANDVQRRASAVLTAVVDAETGARGYLITEDTRFLEAYSQSAPHVPALLEAATDAATSADERAHMAQLRRLARERMQLVDARVAEGRQGRFIDARAAVAAGEGKRLTDALRGVVREIDREQSRLREQRTEELGRALRLQAVALWTLLALFGVALVGGLAELRRRLHHHEQIVTMCAWSHTIRDGEQWVSVEDYLHRHYGVTISHGISPEQFAIAARAVDEVRKQRQPTA